MAPEQIVAALQKLDVNNDGHWTQDGLPRIETVRLFAGNQSLTRENITAAAPDFTRLVAYNAQQAAQAAPAPTAAATTETQPGAQDTPPAAPPLADPAPQAAPSPEPTPEPTPTPVVNAAAVEAPKFDELSEEEQLEVIQGEIAEMDRYLYAAKKHRAELQFKADDLTIRIDKKLPKNSNQQDIQSYLASQRKQLQRRAEQIANVRKVESELGAKLADFAPKRAPIDAAMARRTGYGRNRPGR